MQIISSIRNTGLYLIVCLISLFNNTTYGQDSIPVQKMNIQTLFDLAVHNHPSLAVSEASVAIARQNTAIAKQKKLPEVTASASEFYLGDAALIDKNLSGSERVPLPHFGNSYALEAKELIWKGGLVKNSIKVSGLGEELAALNHKNEQQNVKILVLGYYLDLFKLYNQKQVYWQNIELARKRLDLTEKLYKQGMITKNDIIRNQLQISELELASETIQNNIKVLSDELDVALGMPVGTLIVPDTTILHQNFRAQDLTALQQDAYASNPTLQLAAKETELLQTEKDITKSEKAPAISLFAGNELVKPITNVMPVIDKYMNTWNAGISLNYNIASLYTTNKKLKLNDLEIEKNEKYKNALKQKTTIAVNSAYIKYNEACSQRKTLAYNKALADENYRIIEKKYLNQLALIVDIMDASNSKLEAELKYTNAEINIVYAYYKLLKETGKI
ncbi:TolC family protein [Sphingobacterium thalpophilum]|uniref:TolC family protein n=1 Tax=Sphingobacterium thalpophilum TaxID=259 RepID=UPI0024A69C33|nr:TolC family protein [Sphingobacterium thalpophilum]